MQIIQNNRESNSYQNEASRRGGKALGDRRETVKYNNAPPNESERMSFPVENEVNDNIRGTFTDGEMGFPNERSTFNDHGAVTDNTERRKKKAGSRSAVVGLRVRSNSNHLKPGMPGVGTLSGVSNALNDPQELFDYFYKVIVIGDEGVGKTNFLLRICKNFYDPQPRTTYGVEFLLRTVALPNSNQKVRA